LQRAASDIFPPSHNADHYKYQTIQSFRPEEVKELLAQHFLDPTVNGRTSAPEDGIRRFSLVRSNFKARRAFRNSKDAATLRGMVDDSEGSQNGSTDDLHTYDRSEGETPQQEVARLRTQLTQERSIHAREMSKMRSQLRAFEAHLAQSVARMGSLLEMIDAREKAVQDLLSNGTRNMKIVDENGVEVTSGNEIGNMDNIKDDDNMFDESEEDKLRKLTKSL